MPIVIFVVALAATVAVAILYPQLRIIASVFVAFFLGLIAYMFLGPPPETDLRRARIALDQLVLTDVALQTETRYTRLVGRAQNMSELYRLEDFDVRVMLYDCPAADTPTEECTAIAEDQGTARVDLPPGQLRSFQTVLRFSDVPEVKGFPAWDYAVTGIRARR